MEAQTALAQIYTDFTNTVVNINNYKQFTKTSTERSFAFYEEQLEKSKEVNAEDFGSFNSLFIRNIENNQLTHVGKNENSMEDLLRTVIQQQNRQYQCFLVEAYEVFEDYLDSLYELICQNGALQFDEKIKNKPLKKLRKIRELFKTIELLERKNPEKIDYFFMIILISVLRQYIVHERGVVPDIEKFQKDILEPLGTLPSELKIDDYKNEILSYVGKKDNQHFIVLLEQNHREDKRFNGVRYHDTLNELIKILIAYAELLNIFCLRYLCGEGHMQTLIIDPKAYIKFFEKSDMYKHLRA